MRRFSSNLFKGLLVLLTVAGGCGDDSGSSNEASLLPLHAVRGERPGIFDSEGRQVLLRGVNLNSLGDYYQGNPAYPPTIPLRDDEFKRIAAQGFNSIRLIVSWSYLEPQPGVISTDYIARIRDAVLKAKEQGLYTVLDMHQDAWGKFIATPPGTDCGAREAAIGWDGAPEWATLTDGKSTCRQPGSRELSPAVMAAFENFYADKNGIQTHLIDAWSELAAAFANEPAVAGYDLLNEPNFGSSLFGGGPKLAAFSGRVIQAIREAERRAGGPGHVVFFEPVITWPVDEASAFTETFTDDTNLVFAPHNYGESITGLNQLTIEQVFARAQQAADRYQTTFWIGEYGWFGDPSTQKALLKRYAAEEDRLLVGSAWWQWRQACGDPHSVGHPGGEPAAVQVHYNRNGCPGDVDLGPVEEWHTILSRPYPRAAAGRIVSLASDGDLRTMTLRGATDGPDGTVDLWIPDGPMPTIAGSGVQDVSIRTVAGGYRAEIDVAGTYEISVD